MNSPLDIIILLFFAAWFIRTTKAFFFWAYLFQIKEYKWKRFIDHFRTEKGRSLILDKAIFVKLLILAGFGYLFFNFLEEGDVFFIISLGLFILLLGIYLWESFIGILRFLNGTLKMPTFTKNAIAITAMLIAIELGFAVIIALSETYPGIFIPAMLLFDILVPFITGAIVTLLKPIDRLIRRKIINAAKAKRLSLKNLLVIGITGSYGKTSTKEFLYEILKDKFNVIRTPEHVNTEIGASKFILDKLSSKHEIFICEMGAYEKGEIKETADIVRPQVGVFLGANEQHLSLFGKMENLLKAEGGEELLEALKANALTSPRGTGALGIFNGNNVYAYELWKRADIPKRITYAPNLVEIINPEKRDVRAENIRVERDHITFKVLTNKNSKGVEFRANLLGAHNIENILLCIALGESLGLTLEEMKKSVKEITPLKRTMSLDINQDGINIVNSTYSSNPSAVIAHLEYLKAWNEEKNKGRKVVIMPCLIELGSASATIHERVGRELAKVADLSIITTYDRFQNILEGAKSVIGKNAHEKILFIENTDQIIRKVADFTKKGDVILLEGRLQENLVSSLCHPRA